MIKIDNPGHFVKKLIIITICMISLIYQINVLTTEYIKGTTIVSLYVGRLQSVALPAFTICSDEVISIEKASRMRPEFAKIYKDYEELNSKLIYLPNRNPENSSESIQIIKEMNKLYEQVNSQIDLSKIPASEIIRNWSITWDQKYLYFDIIFQGVFRNGSEIKTKFTTDDIELNPIESIKLKWSEWGEVKVYECFTVFSPLNKQWRDFEMNLERITIDDLMSQYKWIPPRQKDIFYFAMHSPNTFPDLTDENFIEIRNDHFYTFFYSQVNTEKLGTPYDTNCFDYDLDHKFANFSMRSDCRTDCYQTRMMERCKLTNMFAGSNMLLRSAYILQNPEFTIDNNRKCVHHNHIEIKGTCRVQCKFDCSFKYYLLEKVEKNFNELADSFNITIQRNVFPDVVIKYLPKTTFISFVCNFGGLMGMWLGLSVLVICEEIISFIFNFIKHPTTYFNMIKNNFFTTNIFVLPQNLNERGIPPIRTNLPLRLPRNVFTETFSPLSVKSVFNYIEPSRH